MAVSRILSADLSAATIIYLTQLQFCSRRPLFRHLRPQNWGWAPETLARIVMRRYPRINGPAALPLFCLAPHGVFPASRIAPRAVSSYLAFSTLPVPLLPKNRRCLFCDTFRHRNFATAAPACFTRHVAVWCSDFPPASHCGSPAIICHRRVIYHNHLERKETGITQLDLERMNKMI